MTASSCHTFYHSLGFLAPPTGETSPKNVSLDGAYFFKNILIDFNKSYDFLLLLRLCRL
jgi:hypothetical protein